jgi:oligopeptide transport system substrate-binding protein
MTFVISSGQIDFDPLHAYSSTESQLYTAIYEGLVTYNPLTLEPIPGIARYWEVSDDGLVYTFYLRDGLLYWNSDRFTADDVKNSWLRMIDPARKAEYSVFFDVIKGVKEYKENPGKGTDGIGIKALDTKTLEVTLDQPASHFLKLMCHMSFMPIHSKYLKSENWGNNAALISNGPFYILERNPKRIVLAKNKLYWDAANVDVDKLIVLFSDDPITTSGLFNSGVAQWALSADIESIKDRNALVLNAMFSTTYFYFNCDKPPFDDPKVRRALALLLPWDEMRSADYLFKADTLVPRISGYPEIKGISKQDEEEALGLLKEAGVSGETLPVITINISDDEDSKKLAGIMKDTWEKKLGCKVNVTPRESNEYFDSLKSNDYTLAMMSWIGDFADPLTFLQMWTSGSNLNDANFKDPTYDSLIDESLKETGEAKYEVLGRAEQIILDGAMVLPIKRSPAFNIINLRLVDGWYPNALDIHPFKYIRFKEDEILQNITMFGNLDKYPIL